MHLSLSEEECLINATETAYQEVAAASDSVHACASPVMHGSSGMIHDGIVPWLSSKAS